MKTLKLVLPLTVISAICACILALVNLITEGPISRIRELKANHAARVVLPAGTQVIDMRADPADADPGLRIAIGYSDADKKTVTGYAVPGISANGYAGDIRLMVGLTPDRVVVSYQVLAANETPGLGARLGDEAFVKQFSGKSGAALKVRKDGGDIDAISGATITSRAVCDAIADACARVDRLEGRAATATPVANPAVHEGKMLLDPTQASTALLVLPRGTVSATPRTHDAFPIFEGADAAGKTTGYAVVGTGRGKGPDGEILVRYLYGFKANGRLSLTPPPRPVNTLDIDWANMATAQGTAINAALQDAQAKIAAFLSK